MGILRALLGQNSAIPEHITESVDWAEQGMRPAERQALELATRGNGKVTINIFVIASGGGAHIGHNYGHEGRCQ